MNPNEMQPNPNMPQEEDQDQAIVEFLQELDDRITALEGKVASETPDTTEQP